MKEESAQVVEKPRFFQIPYPARRQALDPLPQIGNTALRPGMSNDLGRIAEMGV
jgi:hypothetical protein